MSTFLEVQQRIASDYLNRSDYGNEVKRSILAAIRYYERRRWRFNETASSIACSSGQTFVSLPANFLVLDHFRINATGGSYELHREDLADLLDMRADSSTGIPTHYTIQANKIELFAIPNSAYSCPLYYIKSLTELSADADTNAWTQGGMQDLIAYHATKLMWRNVIRNEKEAKLHSRLEATALMIVSAEMDQFNFTSLKPTRF